MTPKSRLTDQLAKKLFALVGDVLRDEGLSPTDPEVANILAVMVAAHFGMRGGGAELRQSLLVAINRAMDLAERDLANR